MLAYAKSDIGKVRETNEDSFVCMPPLFIVADGMGGHVAGEVASRMATDAIRKYFTGGAQATRPELLLKQAIDHANSLILEFSRNKSGCAGMGTTVTAIYADGTKLYWGHVGDSRMYLLHNGKLLQVTEDHSLVGELVRSGSITPEEALTHPQRNILTRAVGTNEQLKVDCGVTEWTEGDKVLICTDGLTNMVMEQEIYASLVANLSGEEVLEKLFELANAAGGLDNITAILVQNGDS